LTVGATRSREARAIRGLKRAERAAITTMKSVAVAAVVGAILGLAGSRGQAQGPVIESLSPDGELRCTGLKPGSTATVEWAPSLDGPWTNTWTALDAVEVAPDGTIRVRVPLFHRVRGEPEPGGPPGMVWIPPGTYTMGSPVTERNRGPLEGPETVVTLTQGFWLGKCEVTQREYLAVTGSNPSPSPSDPDRPVVGVTWYAAVDYCRLRTAQERATGRLPAGYEYRLPTEAQWEYVCRAGTTTRFSFGDALECKDNIIPCQIAELYMWAFGSFPHELHRVGQRLPNPWGVYDMHGNVTEWCEDYWAKSLPGGGVTDPTGPSTGIERVTRGGSYGSFLSYCRSAARGGTSPGSASYWLGFRAALVPIR
jgi:formylglycine-generating enzyme required for sulfatase activity